MIDHIVSYFYPVEREGGKWRLISGLRLKDLQRYMVRSGVPALVFWSLDLFFLPISPPLAALCLTVSLPFFLVFALLLRNYIVLKNMR